MSDAETSQRDKAVIEQTRRWIQEVVIGLNLCPFAARPFGNDRIHYQVVSGKNFERHLQALAEAFQLLDHNPDIETALLIFPDNYNRFNDYLDLLDLGNALLQDLEYAGNYQLASFHPRYLFEGSTPSDPANFTNRSPWPMLHLLRESSIDAAIKSHHNVKAIPEINISKLQELGFRTLQAKLDNITGRSE
ncbi:MAG TPA: DUF1415 domain-containing protein [Gammaproteobacteria bacterium]|nr:DUF1415 domain-containing protein [Gammaproteobacteria bacterium]